MKNILIILVFLVIYTTVSFSQSFDSLGTVIGSKITTGRADSGIFNPFPTHISTYGKGGFQEVANITSRNNIVPLRRKLGMIVYTRADSSFWQLRNDTSNSNWTRLSLGVTPKVDSIYRTSGKDSIQFKIDGRYYAIRDSVGGSTFSDSGNFAKLNGSNIFTQNNTFQNDITVGKYGVNDGKIILKNATADYTTTIQNPVTTSANKIIYTPDANGTIILTGDTTTQRAYSDSKYVPKSDSTTGVRYITQKKLDDSTSTIRTDLARKSQLNDSTSVLRTDLYRKDTHVTDSTNARNYSNSLYLKNADSTTLKNSINVAGTLSNVAYLNQVNRFSATQRLATGKGLLLSNATNAYHDGIVVADSSIYFQTNVTDTTLVAGGSNRVKINTLGLTTTHVLPFATNTFDLGTSSLYYRRLYTKDMTFYDGVGTAVPITSGDASLSIAGDINIGAYSYYNTLNLNGLAYWDAGYKIASIANVASGGLLMSNGTGANVPSYLPLGSSGTVLSSMAGQTVPTYNSKVFLYPSDSAFIVTSSIKNKNVASYVQQGDTSAFVSDFTTGTGKPQMRIKDPTGATTLYIDSTGQINGSEVANGDLTLQGTTNATRTTSYVNLQPNGGFVGIGMTAPTAALDITNTTIPQLMITNTSKVRMRAGSAENGFECWKDATPTKAVQIGMGTQGSAITDDIVFSVYGGVSWAEAARITNTTKSLQMIGKITKYNNVTPPANTVMVGNGTDASLSTSVNIDSIRTRILAFDGQAPGVYRGTMGWDSTNRRFLATSYLVQRSIDLSHAILTADVVDSSNTNEVVLDSIPMAINFPSVGKVVTIHLMGIATVPNPQALTLILRQTLAGTVLDSVRINPSTGVTDKAIDIDVTVTYRVINGASSQLVALMRANVNGVDYASTPQGVITFNVGALNTLYVNAKMSATGNQKVRIRQGYATTIN